MLKIKDNVHISELEKFGFEFDKDLSGDYEKHLSIKQEYQKLCIDLETRLLYLYEPFNSNAFLLKADLLYDLIKADLVEKVDD